MKNLKKVMICIALVALIAWPVKAVELPEGRLALASEPTGGFMPEYADYIKIEIQVPYDYNPADSFSLLAPLYVPDPGDWSLFFSLAIYEEQENIWSLQTRIYRARFTGSTSDYLYYRCEIPANKASWVRYWGHTYWKLWHCKFLWEDLWLSVNQGSLYFRNSQNSSPGYEQINIPTGVLGAEKNIIYKVPAGYDLRP